VTQKPHVRLRCGWFSGGSACCLAAGRAILSRDAGLSDWLPADADSNLACLDRIGHDCTEHRGAAQQIARARFGYETVLPQLLEIAPDATAALA
jgi:hypothetical protein